MRRLRASSLPPCTHLPSTRRRQAKAPLCEHDLIGKPVPTFPDHALERRSGPPRFLLLDLRLARNSLDPERRDAVALTPQHAKTETVEGKTLAALRDRPGLMDHEAR